MKQPDPQIGLVWHVEIAGCEIAVFEIDEEIGEHIDAVIAHQIAE